MAIGSEAVSEIVGGVATTLLEVFYQEGELFVFGLVGGAKPCKFGMDGVDGGAVDDAVCNAGVT